MLGLAAGTFGLGPDDPPRDAAFETPSWFRHHGGAVGEGLFWIARTLFQEIGAHILFVFLFVAGFMLLTGASIAGAIRATSESVRSTTRRVKRSTTEFARLKPQPERAEPPEPVDVEPVVRATHVEAPSIEEEWDDEVPEVVEGQAIDTEDGEEDDEFIVHAAPPPPKESKEPKQLTPQGNVRSSVTEADDNTYTIPPARHLKRGNAAANKPVKGDEKVGQQLIEALGHFGIEARIVGTVAGPHVTRYELKLAPGIKMSKVANLKDDIAYALAASEIRILAPIPGKTAVGVEVPNSRAPDRPPRRRLPGRARRLVPAHRLARQGHRRQGDRHRPRQAAARARGRHDRLGQVRLRQRDAHVDPAARLPERGEARAGRSRSRSSSTTTRASRT